MTPEQYRHFNEQQRRVLIFHVGIDAGFFAEFTYMVNAMLFCAKHHYQFRLYSRDANFGCAEGWGDYFEPFCPEATEAFHHRLNVHRLPSWGCMLRQAWQRRSVGLLVWKANTLLHAALFRLVAFRAYGRRTLSTHDVSEPVSAHYHLPELGIDGSYVEAFAAMARVAWRLNAGVRAEGAALLREAGLPAHYVGTQLRGGDKVTETELRPAALMAQALQGVAGAADVLVLTDDYRLFVALQHALPALRLHTLCRESETGYVNSAFTHMGADAKRAGMVRLLSQVDALLHADAFVGSITVGPSLFLLKLMGQKARAVDCAPQDFERACRQPIAGRAAIARAFLATHR